MSWMTPHPMCACWLVVTCLHFPHLSQSESIPMRHTTFSLVSLIALWLIASIGSGTAAAARSHRKKADDFYRVAAVQFTPSGSYRDPPLQVISESIDRFEPFIQNASARHAHLVVFPEGATGMFNAEARNTRDAALPYCTTVDGDINVWNPCRDHLDPPPKNSSLYQLWRVSCFAMQYSIHVAFDTCEVRKCDSSIDPSCPADGRYQWNTFIVFNDRGVMIARYHKAHLFGEGQIFDQASPVPTTFTTTFGVTFGLFVCFDILYPHPAGDLVKAGITDFIFASWWVNPAPSTNAMIQQQAFSRLNQVNLIASNIGASGANSGGGIYASGEVRASLFEPDAMNVNQVLIAKLPLRMHPKPTVPSTPRLAPIRHAVEVMSHSRSSSFSSSTSSSHRVHSFKSYELSSLVYNTCQPNRMFAGSANCTTFNSSTIQATALELGLVLDEKMAGMNIQIPVTMGGLSCMVEVGFDKIVEGERFAVFAYEGVQLFPDTPGNLSMQICALQHCNDMADSHLNTPSHFNVQSDFACSDSYKSYDSHVSNFNIVASGIESDASPFPMVGIKNGQLLKYTNHTQFIDKTVDGTRAVQWSTTDAFKPLSLYSTLIYGIRP